MRGSHGLSARMARRTKSSRPEGPKAGPKGRRLEVGARRAPRLLVYNIYMDSFCCNVGCMHPKHRFNITINLQSTRKNEPFTPVGSLSPQLLNPQRRVPSQSASTSQSPSPAEQGSDGLKIDKFKSSSYRLTTIWSDTSEFLAGNVRRCKTLVLDIIDVPCVDLV